MTDHEIDEPLGEAVDEAIDQAIGEACDEAIGEELVRSLIEERYPDLAALELHQSVRGWDNQLWWLGDELAVRLPRTPRAPDLLRKEHRWLPLLAQRLPLPVPTPSGSPNRPTSSHTLGPSRNGSPASRRTVRRSARAGSPPTRWRAS